ncbi:MAG TPA: NRDE family protein, partial [Casimicrobiaceae bacterium]|nr:NRDE family protein [Casimicrobiaceae bacterium]
MRRHPDGESVRGLTGHVSRCVEAALDGLTLDSAAVFVLLADRVPAEDATLPMTGVSREWERMLSSAFIVSPEYGTRCSTVFT